MPPGVTDGSNAAAGQVGEYLSTLVTAAVGIASSTWTTIGALTLTPGDWDVWGQIGHAPAAAATQVYGELDTLTTPTGAVSDSISYATSYVYNGSSCYMALTPVRLSITANTTVYLHAYCNNTSSVTGKIQARRRR
jgi:hypothetical protein